MKRIGGKKLTGRQPLAYLGVEPVSPPQLVDYPRAPTTSDYKNFNIGCIWLVYNAITKIASQIWMLVGLSPSGTATWVKLYPTAGSGTVLDVTANLPITITGTADVHPVVNLPNGADGSVLISGGVAPTWHTLTAGNAVGIVSAAGSITINSLVNFFTGSDAQTVNPDAGTGVVRLIGAGGATITKTAANEITITAGGGGGGTVTSVNPGDNINITSLSDPTIDPVVNLNKSILQPLTNALGTEGIYALGSTGFIADRFLHNYGAVGAYNTFLGLGAGNLTLTTASSINNTGLGGYSLRSLTSGDNNTTAGVLSLTSITTAGKNCAYGVQSLQGLVNGNFNLALGYQSGITYDGAESKNILLMHAGTHGESFTTHIGTNGQQTSAYFAGIYDVALTTTPKLAVVDSNDKLGTIASAGTAGQYLISGGAGASPSWITVTPGAGVITTVYDTPGSYTWTKNANTKYIIVYGWSGGAGGGGGSATVGGGGGGSGGVFKFSGPFNFFGATETVTVGAAGLGGAINTAGGNLNTSTRFGNIYAPLGNPGAAPGAGTSGIGGISGYAELNVNYSISTFSTRGGNGLTGLNGENATDIGSPVGGIGITLSIALRPTCGGGGGSTGFLGGRGGNIYINAGATVLLAGGLANLPGNDALIPSGGIITGGTGGGGGNAGNAGGKGGFPGGGGGGAGTASVGGDGGSGKVIVIEFLG